MHRTTTTDTGRSPGSPAYYQGRSARVWHLALGCRNLPSTRARPSVDAT
jgi:hypothetical protein